MELFILRLTFISILISSVISKICGKEGICDEGYLSEVLFAESFQICHFGCINDDNCHWFTYSPNDLCYFYEECHHVASSNEGSSTSQKECLLCEIIGFCKVIKYH